MTNYVKAQMMWDALPLAECTSSFDEDSLNLARWNCICLRFQPQAVGEVLTIYESTLIVVEFQRVDSMGRRLTR